MISCFKGKFKVTSPRGYRTHPITGEKGTFHKGIDLVGIQDTIVYSISEGIATTAYQANGAGYYVVVTMDDGRRVFYMHLAKDSFKVINGQRVSRGQALGVMGSTGNSTGAHTHLELRPAGTTYDSLDITEFCNIPNKIGTYEYKEETNMKFKDVPDTHWAAKAIEELSEKRVINGYEDGTFRPSGYVTRAEIAVMLARSSKHYDSSVSYGNPFYDVSSEAYYHNEVAFCASRGYMEGYPDGDFKPDNNLTRAEAAVLIVRFMEGEK